MLACAVKPAAAARRRRDAMQRSPVWRGRAPRASTTATWRYRGLLVAGEQLGERRSRRARPAASRVEQPWAVGRLGDRLRGDRADARARPRDDRADGEPVRLHGDADLPAARVARDDRVGAAPHRRRRYQRPADARSLRARCAGRRATAERPRARGARPRRRDPRGLRTHLRRHLARRAALQRAPCCAAHGDRVPWHRVVRADGSLAQGERQRALLDAEAVPVSGPRVDLRVARLPPDVDPA